ncbi:MAG: hypothetical protein KAJ19_03290, partial [Gammaproteobacteria bacterium]|nr:hypothetical protein [Gammaproteobacteria bacterium]
PMPNNLQTKILKYIKQHDKAVAYKIETANERGVPDILCCLNGVFVAIEVKEGKDTVKPIQEAQVDRILEAGGHAWFIRDFKIFKTLFEGVYHGNGKQQRTN